MASGSAPPVLSGTAFPSYDPPPGAVDRPHTAPSVVSVSPGLAELSARFWGRVRLTGPVRDPATCWLYDGPPSRPDAPIVCIRRDHVPAARVAYELTGHGSTAGLKLLAACGRGACCRPRHQTRQAIRPDFTRSGRYGRSVAEIVAGYRLDARWLAASRRDASAPSPPSPPSASPALLAPPTALATVPPVPSRAARLPSSAPPLSPPAPLVASAVLVALLLERSVTVSRAAFVTYVFTPWGKFEDADPCAAMRSAWDASPDAVRARHAA